MKIKIRCSSFVFILFVSGTILLPKKSFSQYTSKQKNQFHKAYHDSLIANPYPYTFPLLAKKAYKKGFDVPYTYGIGTVYYNQRQDVLINKTMIGINDIPPVDMSGLIRFGNIEAHTIAYTVRPDMWILPFLNVYSILGTGSSETTVPLVSPVNFTTVQKFNVKSVGFGATLAGGLGPVFIVVDNNINFADVEVLVEPVPAYNLDMRIGHNFVHPRRADRGLAIWFGTFYQNIDGDTKGSITIKDLFPNGSPGLEDKFIERLEEWAEGLPPAKQVVADQIITKIDAYLSGLDVGDTKITYNLDKELAKRWNLVFGAQYQHNKHWMIRTELGTFGRRTSFLLMLNYRFEHIGKSKR